MTFLTIEVLVLIKRQLEGWRFDLNPDIYDPINKQQIKQRSQPTLSSCNFVLQAC